jgi:hypothetical protein
VKYLLKLKYQLHFITELTMKAGVTVSLFQEIYQRKFRLFTGYDGLTKHLLGLLQ